MQIVDLNLFDMTTVAARLVREGVTFKVVPTREGLWMVIFTGGY